MFGLGAIFFKAMIIDTHCHLMEIQFKADLQAVLRRAALERVKGILNLGCDIQGSLLSDEMCRIDYQKKLVNDLVEMGIVADRVPVLYGSQGVHPHDSNQTTDDVMENFGKTIHSNSRIVVVGETGLDYFYMNQPQEVQLASLRRHMVLAGEVGLPVSLHCRDSVSGAGDAARDILMVMREFPRVRCVMHCFSQDQEFADRVLEMSAGHILSFSGVVTYPKSEVLRRVAVTVPADRMVVETDAPYLAPQPYRGKRNEPAFLGETVKYIAQLRGLKYDQFAQQSMENAKRFFALPA